MCVRDGVHETIGVASCYLLHTRENDGKIETRFSFSNDRLKLLRAIKTLTVYVKI